MSENYPVISVVIPYYNQGKLLLEAIRSVEAIQDKCKIEIIIVNDGCTDPQSIEVVRNLTNGGYHVINQHNQGLGAARNNGIRVAKGKYILPLDSDNKIKPDYINRSLSILESRADIGIVYANPKFFGSSNNKRSWKVPEFNEKKMLLGNYIDACAVYRKLVWEKVGGYDERMPWMGHEDWDFWIKAIMHGFKFYHLKEELYYYRITEGSMIAQVNTSKDLDNFTYILKKHAAIYASQVFKHRPLFMNISVLSEKKLYLLGLIVKVLKRIPF